MSEITESEERLARPLIRLAKLVGVGTSYLGMSHDYHEIDDDVLIEVLAALGIAVYGGRTELIHRYHQTNVTDKEAYARAFGKALLAVAAAPLLSGIIGLLGDDAGIALLAAAVLVIGTGIGIGRIASVQKKYNGGMF